MAKYKVGDKVRIVDKWEKHSFHNDEGLMDEWLGKVMTIKSVVLGCGYFMEEDQGTRKDSVFDCWLWSDDMIAGLVSEAPAQKSDEKIVIFRKGDKVIARHYVGKRIADEAVATCSKDDEFVFDYGASLAAHRLFAKRNKKTIFTEYRKRINDAAFMLCGVVSDIGGRL